MANRLCIAECAFGFSSEASKIGIGVQDFFFKVAIEQILDTFVVGRAHLIHRPNRQNVTFVQNGDSICNPESAFQFVRNDDDGHVEGISEAENQLV